MRGEIMGVRLRSAPMTLYRLTSSQIMELWEEAFSISRWISHPGNYLYFQMTLPYGDAQALKRAYNKVVETNDSLRLRLCQMSLAHFREGISDYRQINIFVYRLWLFRLRQYIADPVDVQLAIKHVADQSAFLSYLDQFRHVRQPLLNHSLASAELVQIGVDELALVARFHHVIMDGYSFKLLFEQLSTYYESYLDGIEPHPEIHSITRAFASDEQYLNSPRRARDIAYWKKIYATQPKFSLPAGHTPFTSSYRTVNRILDGRLYTSLVRLAESSGTGCSPYALLLIISAMTVYRLSGVTNFALYHMSHGRFDAESRLTIGCLINMVPIFFDLDPHQSFAEVIRTGTRNYLEALMHSRLSFNECIMLYLTKVIRRTLALNQAWMVLSSLDFEASVAHSHYQADTFGATNQPHQFFGGIMEIPGEGIHLYLRYQIVKHESEQIEKALDIFMDTVETVVNFPDSQLGSLLENHQRSEKKQDNPTR